MLFNAYIQNLHAQINTHANFLVRAAAFDLFLTLLSFLMNI